MIVKLTDVQIKNNKERFIALLKSVTTKCQLNMDSLIDYLVEETDFFIAPASSRFHGAFEGGLCAHSLAVYDKLTEMYELEPDDPFCYTLIIVGLLHDICKVNTYGASFKNVKQDDGKWYKVPCYISIEDQLPMGHGEKSVYIIQKFFDLTDTEALAIRWHMGAYETDKWKDLEAAQTKCELCIYLHFADLLATRQIC